MFTVERQWAAMAPTLFLLVFVLTTAAPLSAGRTEVFPKEALPTRSGYLPIPPFNASLFFAFYEATHPITPPAATPLVLWLEGGPGCSALLSAFLQIGPYSVRRSTDNDDNSAAALSPNPFPWNRRFGLLFVDSPLGTGFSAAPSHAAIPTDQSVIAAHVLAALQSFFELDPSLRKRPLFLAGESYAGKFVPATAARVLAANPTLPARRRINLRGAAIGNALVHPVTQVATNAEVAYFRGLVSAKQRRELEAMEAEAVALARAERWSEASDARARLLARMQDMTGLATLFDVETEQELDFAALGELLNRPEAKAALGARADAAWEVCSDAVAAALHEDVMKSAKREVEALLRGERKRTRVLLYEGIRDMRDGAAAAEAWLRELVWDGLAAFWDADRVVWRTSRGGGGGDGGEVVAGYVQGHGALAHVVVRGAGHFVPAGNGRAAREMMEDWVLEAGLFGCDAGRVSVA